MKEPDGSTMRSVDRAVAILDALSATTGRRTLTEVAAAAGLSLPTTLRILRTLAASGLVIANREGGYTLGFRILELAHALTEQLDITALGQSYLDAARDRVNETSVLVVRTGDCWTPVCHAEATQPVRRVMHLGERVPLYADSAGKLILAHDTDAEIDEYLARVDLVPYSATTTCDPAEIREEIRLIRQRGWSWSVNARGAGGAGTAHPVYRHGGEFAAALLIVCPATRFDETSRLRNLAVGEQVARELSVALGWRPSPAAPPPLDPLLSRSIDRETARSG